jgi:hypothetical protein
VKLFKELKSEIKKAQRIRLPWWALLCILLVTITLCFLFDDFGKLALVVPTMNSVLVISFVIAIKWQSRRSMWFWVTMTVIAILHVLLILFVPWSDKWVPGAAIACIDAVDFLAILAILFFLERLIKAPKYAER